jgi:mannosylfructose-6-phosphate phosphatase
MERVNLLVSDLDYTLLGDDRATEQFGHWYRGARDQLRLAYSSGRFCESMAESVRSSGLPEPDALIGGVGTEICLLPLQTRIGGWPPEVDGWNEAGIRAVLAAYRELKPQPAPLLSKFKISYYGYDLSDAFLRHLRRQLVALGHHAEIIYSSHRDLDILPAGANKGTAAAHLAQYWKIDPERVIVAGDSGNDREMFRHGFRGIVVGNAQPELQELKNPSIYHATGRFAAGVIEGLNYWLADASMALVTNGPPTPDPGADRGRH